MNGVVKITNAGRRVVIAPLPVMVFEDGTRERMKFVTMDASVPIEFLSTVDSVPQQPPSVSDEQRWLQIALRDNAVADALVHFIQSDGWFDIYKTGEVIQSSVSGGRKAVDEKGWIAKGNYDKLMYTANFYRHADKGQPLPDHLQTIDHANALLRILLRKWIEQR